MTSASSYEEAVAAHYKDGAPRDWPVRFVSSYASMHPWEDWAETWAHYLHMVDTLDTARSFGVALRSRRARRPASSATRRLDFDDFDDLARAWIPLTVALNSLNRSMGLPDLYPFVALRAGAGEDPLRPPVRGRAPRLKARESVRNSPPHCKRRRAPRVLSKRGPR